MPAEPVPDLLLPDGACLLHIGPPKTGTTSLQAAFWAARQEALEQGVRYAGRSRHEVRAALAVARSLEGIPDQPEIAQWNRLAGEVRAAREPRVVLSSEALSYAAEPAARRIAGDLAPRRVHVVITLRPLARILPSAWQQFVKNHLAEPYEPWLRAMLDEPPGRITPLFWRQQRHDELVARWAAVAGTANTTVVVADDRDRDGLLRTFEGLTGLRRNTLVPVADLANRSMTAAEVEVVRALNDRLRAEGFSRREIDRIVRGGAAEYLLSRAPDPSEPRLETPRWALDRAAEIAAEMVAGIRSSGVRVLGNLELLAADTSAAAGAGAPASADPILTREAAAWLAFGMYRAGRRDPDITRLRSRQLAEELARRVPAAITRRLRRPAHRG